jgi:hypothetical protein
MGKFEYSAEDFQADEVTAGLHPAVLEVCETRAIKSGPNAGKPLVYWQFSIIEDEDPGQNGLKAFAHTPVPQFMLKRYLSDLGVTWEEFNEGFGPEGSETEDTSHLQGALVLIEVEVGKRKNRDTGEPEDVRNVTHVYPKE